MPSPPVLLRERLSRVRILQPLAHRDFALLTTAAAISLLGDGFFSVMFALLFWPGVRDPERGLVAPAETLEPVDTLAEAS